MPYCIIPSFCSFVSSSPAQVLAVVYVCISYIARLLCFWEERGLREPMCRFDWIFLQTLCNSSVVQGGKRSFRIPEQLGVCGGRRAAKIPPTTTPRERIVASGTRVLTSATSPHFLCSGWRKRTDSGPSRKLRLPWNLLFSSERLRWAGWSQSRCPFIHTVEQPINRLFL